MQGALDKNQGWHSGPWRIAAWLLAAVLMLVPISVQMVIGNFGWSLGDFIFFAIVLLLGCTLFDLAARKAPSLSYLIAAGSALAASFGLVVVNGAVGLVGSENESHNLLFLVVVLVAITGTVVAKAKPKGMARAMLAATAAHIFISAALLINARGLSDGDPRMEIIGLTVFAAVWAASAWLFRSASQQT